MTYAIRPARLAEIEAIRGIERASARRFVGIIDEIVDDEPSPAAVLAARIASGGLLAGECEGAPVAFVMFRPVEDGLYIEQIDVLPAFERRRIGAALLDAAAERARAAGLVRLTLSTFREVPWNAPYYRRLGFVDIADDALTEGLAEIRREHVARGLDESRRTFMARPV
ncbi:GNAT family N-acetyltransferase [Nannocystis pusilla]|uniref:GNAT family N-acetyltransferase n=1 Tax=Nannocystis pusilla TaxID=889268 RepID=A0A9X3EX27_9BACT|nr:GNAT family N-acetyltransferase [Nannocystis pusilla]MCY1011701.1 GNAT family N-acetyltransferase [Nannocystis pusilla]